MSFLNQHIAKSIASFLLICLLLGGVGASAGEPEPVSLTVNVVRIDGLLLHVGEITNPRPNMGIAMFAEIFEGLWLIVVTGQEELSVLPLDESGQFARVAYFVNSQNDGIMLVPVHYFIFDLDNVPAEMTLENAEAAALCHYQIIPEEPLHDAALEAAEDGRALYPELDAMLEAQAGQ